MGGNICEPKTVNLKNFPPVLYLANAYAMAVATGRLKIVVPRATTMLFRK